jgi:hypothetical protein
MKNYNTLPSFLAIKKNLPYNRYFNNCLNDKFSYLRTYAYSNDFVLFLLLETKKTKSTLYMPIKSRIVTMLTGHKFLMLKRNTNIYLCKFINAKL